MWFLNRKKTKDVLKERLKVVITYDRAQLSPGEMEELKTELHKVVSRFFPNENQKINVEIEQTDNSMRVVANVPNGRAQQNAGVASSGQPSSTSTRSKAKTSSSKRSSRKARKK